MGLQGLWVRAGFRLRLRAVVRVEVKVGGEGAGEG